MSTGARCLIVCHQSAVDAAVDAVASRRPDVSVDVVAYGRSSEELPVPPGITVIGLPSRAGGPLAAGLRAARWLGSLVGRRYAAVVVAQPHLALSRARGLLLLFGAVVGRGSVAVLDPKRRTASREVGLARALADALRWLVFNATAIPIAAIAARVVERCRPRAGSDAAVPASGTAVYLRSDIDLAIAPLETGGSLAHTDGVLRALGRRGHDVVLWSTGEMAGLPDGIERHRLPVFLRGNLPVEMVELVSGLVQGLTIRRPSGDVALVYQRYSLNNLAGVIAARRWRVPLVLEANASEVKWRQDWGSLRFTALARATERFVFRSAARVAVVSENARRDVVAAGAPPETTVVVPNAVEIDRFRDAAPMDLPFPPDAFVIAFVGLFYPWHGVRYLAEAFVELHRRRPETRLLLVGDGEEASLVRSILAAGGVLEAAQLPGLAPRDAVPRYLAAADALVSPHADVADFIGSPIKIFEYLATGRPIVASRVGQMGDVLVDEGTALLVEPEDVGALADALERLVDDVPLRERLARAAQEDALRRHSWDARMATLLD